MGFLILSNGVPVGYGGSSGLFRQVNTGINIFDEYRGSEASYLWVQVMRVYHHLFGSTRFITNPYQLGGENAEGLQSGAFWFHYRLGYRPVQPAVRALAEKESIRLRGNPSSRSSLITLRRLVSCDMHLTLPGARASDFFDEQWIETSSMLATEILASVGGTTRRDSASAIGARVARDLGLRSRDSWTRSEMRGFIRLAPLIAVANPAAWSAAAKRSMRHLVRAKGGPFEIEFASSLAKHGQFLSELKRSCRKAESR